MSDRARGRLALAGWLVAVVAATALLHASGGGGGQLAPPPLGQPDRWGAWVAERGPMVAAMAILRTVALAAAWYVVATSALGTALRLVQARPLVAAVDWVTLPAVRRLLVSAAGVTLASGVSPTVALALGPQLPAAVAGPAPSLATAAGQPAPSAPTTTSTTFLSPGADPSRPPPTLTMRLLAPEAAPRARAPTEPTTEAPVDVPAAAADPVGTTWRVQPGECFWSTAEDVLTRAWGRSPSDAQIVPFWRALIEANRSALADRANPDLIFPDQVFLVPAPPPA